jgi:hypothetical protein
MLRNYYDRHGIGSVSLCIGTYRTLPIDQRSLATWLSPGTLPNWSIGRSAIRIPVAWWSTATPTTTA